MFGDDEEEEVEQESTGESKTTKEAETSEPKTAEPDLKVMIHLKGSGAIVGVQSPNCDPIFTTVEGDMAAILSKVPALIESANTKWDSSPRNPKADLPQPPAAATPARTPKSTTPEKKQQPSFF